MIKLREIGNSWGIIIPRPILKVLGINPVCDEVDFEIEGKVLKIKKSKKN